MHTRILNTRSNFRASFWFVPTVLMFLAALTAFGMIRFDKTFGKGIIDAQVSFAITLPRAQWLSNESLRRWNFPESELLQQRKLDAPRGRQALDDSCRYIGNDSRS